VHWIPEESMCAITLPLIAPTWAVFYLVPTLLRGNAYGAHSWAEAVIYPFTQPEQPHFMTLTVVHWIPEDSHVCDYAAANRTYAGLT